MAYGHYQLSALVRLDTKNRNFRLSALERLNIVAIRPHGPVGVRPHGVVGVSTAPWQQTKLH
jgi:hypothetical protein